MPMKLQDFANVGLTPALLQTLVETHERQTKPRLEMLWSYYRNPMTPPTGACFDDSMRGVGSQRFRLGQERGLPARLLGASGRAWGRVMDDRDVGRKEIVIENDIAWRIHTMIEFMFGRPIVIASTAKDSFTKRLIERVLTEVFEASGGIGLLQDLALLAHVYGHVDLVVRAQSHQTAFTQSADQQAPRGGESEKTTELELNTAALSENDIIEKAAQAVRIEVIEPSRGIALQNAGDYRSMNAYIIRYQRETNLVEEPSLSKRLSKARRGIFARFYGRPEDREQADDASTGSRISVNVTEILSTNRREVYQQGPEDREPVLIEQGPALVNPDRSAELGPPVVHIQNISQPFEYSGLSEVEPLIPLQDELNTRLSDRASRVTMQSFKMLLAKGLEVENLAIAPGTVVLTENPEARIEAFGGDDQSPSEDRHIDEIREALDKASSVPPLAAGVVRAKIGSLSSENALRVTLLGLLSKTSRKRVTYGQGLRRVCELILEALDRLGILSTTAADRGVRIEWPEPLPRDEKQALATALRKIELGVPRDRVLAELGYTVKATQHIGVE